MLVITNNYQSYNKVYLVIDDVLDPGTFGDDTLMTALVDNTRAHLTLIALWRHDSPKHVSRTYLQFHFQFFSFSRSHQSQVSN